MMKAGYIYFADVEKGHGISYDLHIPDLLNKMKGEELRLFILESKTPWNIVQEGLLSLSGYKCNMIMAESKCNLLKHIYQALCA